MKEIFLNLNNIKSNIIIKEDSIVYSMLDISKITHKLISKNILIKKGVKATYFSIIIGQNRQKIRETNEIILMDNSKLNSYYIFLQKTNYEINLICKQNKNTILNHSSLSINSNKQKIIINERYRCLAKNCVGKFNIDLIHTDNSASQCFSIIDIEKNAKNANMQLFMKSYLFSDKSQSSLIPSLEIKTNDVQATHSAQVEKLNKDSIFYLQTRGLNEKQSELLLKNSIINKYISKIKSAKIQQTVLAHIN